MRQQTGNLSPLERALSAGLGIGLSILALRHRSPGRALAGVAALSLLSRAVAGHCGVKSTLAGHTSLREGLRDQWQRLSSKAGLRSEGMPGSPAHTRKSRAVDESVEESFPASDPPASRLPDEPPVNAADKWAAARGSA